MISKRRAPKLLAAEELWTYALSALSARALTVGELRDKLRRKALQESDIDGVMTKLREYGFLDDKRFADNFATVRRDTQTQGKMRVLRDLRQRRVAPAVAETAVREAYADADEIQLVEQFLARKYRNKDLTAFLKEEKNLSSAFRRLRYAGFAAGPSISVLKRYAARAEELEDQVEE